ncbi:MAG: YD repeat-containing protein [Gammaproteobacteria bacterium]|jgi:YD repeat-containing protein
MVTFTPECTYTNFCADRIFGMDLQSFSRHAGKGFGLCADAGGPIPQQWGLVHLEVPSATSFVTPCPPLPLSDGTLLTKNEIIGHPTYPPPINGIIPDYQQSTYVCSYAPPADPLPVFTPLLTKGEKRQSEGGTPMCGFGNPCNPVTGNKFQKETDYEAVLTFERYFNSQQIYPITTVMGPGWSHNFSGRAFPFTWEGERTHPLAAWIDVLRPDGRLDRMHRRGGSTDTFLSSSDASLRLRLEGTGDGSQWVMHLGSGAREIYHRKGHLLSLIDPAGRATTLHYAGTIQTVVPGYLRPHNNDDMVRNVPKLVEVQGPFGHSLRFFYKDNRRLDYILDPANSRVSYSYDSAGRLSQATYQDGTSRKYDYDDPFDSTNLTGITNERGNLQSHFAYERDDRAILTEHATLPGRTAGQGRYTFSYDEDSSEPFTTTTVTNALGHPHVLTFPRRNGRRSPTHQLLPGGEERSVDTYDARNRPGIITDERGIRTGHTYGPEHLIAVVQALGTAQERTTTYTYLNNLSDLIKTKTEPSVAGAEYTKVTTTDYTPDPDQAGEYLPLASAVRVAGFTPNGTAVSRQHAFSWERVDLIGGPSHQAYFLTQIDGPQAGTTDQSTFAYYAHCPPPALVEHCARLGQPKSITRHNAPGMTITTYFDHYDVHGRLAQETDATGTITQYRYDLRGRLIERTKTGITGLILTTTYEYAPTGSLERINLADGTALHYHYDGAEQLAALSNDAGERTQFEYDLVGDQVKQQTLDSNANVTQVSDRIFDERRRLIATGQRLSSITRFIYDAAGNPTLVTDPNGNSTQLDYDALGRLAFTTDPLGGVTQTQYDIGDRESVVTDALGRETHYLYDDLGNSLETRSPDTGTTSRSFDAAGNLIHARDADGVESNYSYDALDRMTAARYSDPTHDFTLHYDDPAVNGQGRLTGINDESSTTNYAYDQHRRLTQTTQTVAGVGSTLSIVPDEIGRPAQVTYPSGVTISYTRDNIGRVLGLTLTQPGQADKP